MALRNAAGELIILGPHPDEYTAEQWLLRDGDKRSTAAARLGANCDELGCVATGRDGRVVALSLKLAALIEDCTRADVLISAIPIRRPCPAPEFVRDRFDVLHDGAMSLTFTANGVRIETVAGERGVRPWSKRAGN